MAPDQCLMHRALQRKAFPQHSRQVMLCFDMKYRNETEIWIWHLKRGGGHAILNWMAQNAGRPLFHLNNCFSKPFKVRLRQQRIFRTISRSLDAKSARRVFGLDLSPTTSWREIATMHKEILVCTLENVPLERAARETLYHGGAEKILGPSRERINILVLRDAFNTFASVRKSKRRMRRRLKTFYPEHWKRYAREFLGKTSFLPESTLKISYNHWFSSAEYRHDLALRLKLQTSENGLNILSTDGGGSSFSGQELQDRARELDVTGRWRHYLQDLRYLNALDAETIRLSDEIFGDITGGEITPGNLRGLQAQARKDES